MCKIIYIYILMKRGEPEGAVMGRSLLLSTPPDEESTGFNVMVTTIYTYYDNITTMQIHNKSIDKRLRGRTRLSALRRGALVDGIALLGVLLLGVATERLLTLKLFKLLIGNRQRT